MEKTTRMREREASALVRFDGKAPVGFLMSMRGVEGALGIDLEQTSRVAA